MQCTASQQLPMRGTTASSTALLNAAFARLFQARPAAAGGTAAAAARILPAQDVTEPVVRVRRRLVEVRAGASVHGNGDPLRQALYVLLCKPLPSTSSTTEPSGL